MEAQVRRISQQILQMVQEEGAIPFRELEQSLEIPFNLLFLAIDQMVRDRKVQVLKRGSEYIISLRVTWTQSSTRIPSPHWRSGTYRH